MANIRGNNNDNSLTGSNRKDRISGRGGNDQIDGRGGDDRLYGEDGDDIIWGGNGSDLIHGGNGNDTAAFASAVTVDLAAGTATGEGNDTLVSIENVLGSAFADSIAGDAGNNAIAAGDGNDTVFASAGTDDIAGGAGIDLLDFSRLGGAVNVYLAQGSYNGAALGTIAGIENVTGSGFADYLSGDAGDNVLAGGGGADRIWGQEGEDTLIGNGGDDQLWGGAGSDVLIADGGDDLLNGDTSFTAQDDNASDRFVIATSSGCVTVNDFDPGVDKLDLSYFNLNAANPYWTGSAVQDGYHTVITLTGLGSEEVTVVLQGVVYGHLLTLGDMIGGNNDVIPDPPTYPTNGGNGIADIFVINPANGDITITGFEDGLDRMDISGFIHNGWNGFLSNTPDGSAVINFYDQFGNDFSVTLPGVGVPLIDATDYIL